MISPDLEKLSHNNKEPRWQATPANPGTLHRVRWLFVAVVSVAVATIPTVLLVSLISPRLLFPFYLVAVLVSTWWGGTRSGLLANLLSVLVVDYFLMAPYGFFTFAKTDLEWLTVFIVTSLMITALGISRNRREARSREAEQKYRDIFENAVEGIFQTTPAGGFITANPALAQMLGYESPEELIRERTNVALQGYVDPKGPEEFERRIEKHDMVAGFEHQVYRKDRSKIWMSEHVRAVRDESRALLWYEGTVEDITERKQAEEALRESEERYRDLVENSGELICTHDLDGRVLSANRATAEALGYDSNELLEGKNIRDILAPEVRHEFEQYMASLRERGATSGIMLVETSTGERRIWEYYNSLRSEGVATPIVRGMARDITDGKRAEQALLASERKYRDIFTFAPLGIYQSLRDGSLITANDALAEMLGYASVEELLGVKLGSGMYFAEDEREKLIREYEELGHAIDLDIQWKKKDGSTIWVHLSVHTIKGTDGLTKYFEGFVRDITERKRTEMERDVISEVIQSVNLTANLDELLTHVHQSLKRVLYAENCCVVLYDKQTGLLEAPFFVDLVEANPFPMALSKNCTAKVFSSGRPLLMNEAIFAELLDRGEVELIGRPAPSYLAVPLMTPAETIGVIVVQHYEKENVYSQRDVEFLSAVAAQLARAIERKRAEEALRESEERYRELFENAKDAIYVHDLSGRYTSVNRAAEQLSGFTREEILGKHFSNFVAPRDLKHVRTNLCRKLDLENETIYEVDMVTRTGRRVPVEISSRLIFENGVAIGVQGTVRDITDRKRAQEALRIYSQRLIQAQEAEREKIARELHDEIGQVLTAVRINLQSTQRSSGLEENVPRLDESIAIVDEALGRVRELSIELRPSLLDDLGLTAALRWYVDRYAQRTGIIAEVLDGFKEDGRLPRELETACFRIAQEALTNVARHAQAGSVSVQLERSRERMLLTVMDDGVGFDIDKLGKSASAAAALGLRGMEERALAVGGYIEIDSGLERGTRIRATFPLK